MGITVLSKDPSSKTNKIFLVVCLNLSFWAFCYALMTGSTNPESATFYNRLSSLSWSTFSSLSLYLFIYLTNKDKYLKRIWQHIAIFLPAILSIYIYFIHVSINEIVKVSYGWAFITPKGNVSLWELLWGRFYSLNYIIYTMICIWLIVDFGRKSTLQRIQKQSKVLAYSIIITLTIGSITDTIFPLLGITNTPKLAIVSMLIVIGGIWYSVVKYKMMNLSTESVVLDVLKIMNEGLIISDQEGIIVSANRGTLQLLGYEETEIKGRLVNSVFSEQTKNDKCNSCEADVITKYNVRIPVLYSSSVLLDDFGDELGTVSIFQNISQTKQIQKELINAHDNLEKRVIERTKELCMLNIQLENEIEIRKAKEEESKEYLKTIEKQAKQLKIITDNMNDALLIINQDGSYNYHNQRVSDMNYKSEAIKRYGDSLSNTKYFDEDEKELQKEDLPGSRVLKGETIENVILKSIRPDKTLYYSFNGSPVYNESGEITSAVLCQRDITERYIHEQEISQKKEQLVAVKMEAEMKRLDSLNLIGEMGASIAHEIRNPMTTVRGFLQLLGSKPNLLEYENYFRLMIEELDRANSIISEFLLLSRNAPMALSINNLNNIINRLLPLIQADSLQNDINIIVGLEEIPNVELDEQEIRQVILNLSRNGIQSMSTGGVLTIRTYLEGDQVAISFCDQGIGIPPEILENIGKPFLTTKDTGTGLGLAVSYNIVHRHGGTISVMTGKEGTTFDIKLPLKHIPENRLGI